MNPPSTASARTSDLRESVGQPLTPVGRLYLWCAMPQTRAKVTRLFDKERVTYRVAEGECIIADVEWMTERALVMPVRRVLTHRESEEVRALYKPEGGGLTTADFPKVQSYTQFSRASESAWLTEMLDHDRFTSVLQPIVHSAQPTRVYAREALLRGFAPDESIVYPKNIFDAARGCGMLQQLEFAARMAAIHRMVVDEMAEILFVNLTPSAIDDPVSSLERTVDVIDHARIPHERIVFEMVETDQAQDLDRLKALLRSHRDAGFRVALDDVGSGYSSLNLLHQLRPDFIKLDMELIRGVSEDPYKSLIAEKTIEIATALGIQTIAEGVETDAELAWVQSHGATFMQGYAIARPTTPTLVGRTPQGLERQRV